MGSIKASQFNKNRSKLTNQIKNLHNTKQNIKSISRPINENSPKQTTLGQNHSFQTKTYQKRVTGTYKAVIIDGVHILLLRHHVTEAAASGVLEGDAGGFRTQDPVDVVAVVELVIEAFRDVDGLRWVTILNDDEMVALEERPPHLQEIEVADRGDHDVKLIFQQWHRRCSRH